MVEKDSIDKHIQLIKDLSRLSNIQLIAFVNILSVDNPEMFDTLTNVTEWESKVLSEFMKRTEKVEKRFKKESKRVEDMFEPSQYDRVQIGGEK